MIRALAITLALLAVALPAAADVIDVRQGTNMSVAVDPSTQTLLVDLLGGLWRLPVSGGGATMLTAPGSGIAQPRFNAAGNQVVVERNIEGQWDLWLLELGSGTWRQLTDTPFSERQPDFMPGDRSVVFASNRSGREQLWTLDLQTLALRQLSDEPGESRFPAVGPSGSIAYVNRNLGESTLRVLTTGPVGRILESTTTTMDAPSWRPGLTGPVLVYNRRTQAQSDLSLMIDADIRISRRLTEAEDVFVGRAAWLSSEEFVYAADGQLWRRRIASKERRPVHMFAGVAIERVSNTNLPDEFGGAGLRAAAGIRDLSWQPDGRTAVLAALGDIWLLKGRSLRQLTQDPDVDVEPSFIANDNSVAFVSDRSGSFDVWRIDLGSGELAQVTSTPGEVSRLLLTADGKLAYFLLTTGYGAGQTVTIMRTGLLPMSQPVAIAGPYAGRVELSAEDGALMVRGENIDAQISLATHAAVGNLAMPVVGESEPDPARFEELTWSAPPSEPLVLRVGRLFDGIGNDYKRHIDIHIRDGHITDVVARDRLPVSGRVVDLTEATVTPGMIDVHVHHPLNTGRNFGLAWLNNGVTTVREIAVERAAALERADTWSSGRRPGPRLVVASADGLQAADGPANLPGAGAHIVTSGFVHADNSGAIPQTATGAGAVFPGGGVSIALSPLQTTYQDTLAVLGGTGGYLSTGLAAALSRISQVDARRFTTHQLTSIIERAQRSFGRIAIGSDAPLVAYGTGYHDELETLSRAGVPPAQILRWATAGGAMALGLDAELGTIEPGKLADLVIVDGDPLARISDLRRIVVVLKGGNIVAGAWPAAAGSSE